MKWLLSGIFFLSFSLSLSHAQVTRQEYDSGYTYREVTDDICADPNNLCHYYKMVSWDDSKFAEYCYRGFNTANVVVEFMNWRMLLPYGYDPSRPEEYPLIVMLHGAGESGRVWTGRYNYALDDPRLDNNGHNILHGGQEHRNAVGWTPGDNAHVTKFPGVVIFPQNSYNGAWESGWQNGQQSQASLMVTGIIEHVIQHLNIDQDRVYMHGLSNGAQGVWDLSTKRPDLFAAILPMSGVGNNTAVNASVHVTTPIWHFQGGRDNNPNPQASQDLMNAIIAQGGNPRYTLYPNADHGTWQTAYREPDFWSWMLSKNKRDIYVFGGDASLCPGATLRLGFSAGMLEYQWTKNGVDIPGATTRYYDVSETGTYTVKFKRRIDGEWYESNPQDVVPKSSSDFTPVLTNTGSVALPVNLSGVDNRINFTASQGFSEYYWYRNGSFVTTTFTNTRQISSGQGGSGDAGTHTVRVKQANGCVSLDSNPIQVTYNSPQPATPKPNPPTGNALSATEIQLNWTAPSPNEIAYEIWRIRFAGNGYPFQGWQLVEVLPGTQLSYVDKGVRPQGLYRYIVRALHAGGGATFSDEPNDFETALPDAIPPTPPSDLQASNITDTKVILTWDPASDNDLVYQYEVFDKGTLLATITGNIDGTPLPRTIDTLENLIPGMTYFLNVRAVDFSGNRSAFAEGVVVTTLGAANGLTYKYYEFSGSMPGTNGSQLAEPGAFNFGQTPVASGITTNFTNSVRQRNENYVLSFDGFIEIDAAGIYTFFTRSDDGSRLYINGTLVVNNDGSHGDQNRMGIYNFPGPGKYPIRVTHFQGAGGYSLTVRYRAGDWSSGNVDTNYNAASAIPNGKLFQTGTTIQNYYLRTGSDPMHRLSSWTTDPTGVGGTSPASWAGNFSYFNIVNRPAVALDSIINITGTGSKAVVGDNVTLALNAPLNGILEAGANAVIDANHTSLPSFSILHPTSTVNFNLAGTVTIPNASYGNVSLNTSGSSNYTLPLNLTNIQGDFAIASGAAINGTSTNASILRVGGDVTFNNANPNPGSTAQEYTLLFNGGGDHTLTYSASTDLHLFSLEAGFGDRVTLNSPGSRQLVVGAPTGGGLVLKNGAVLDLGDDDLVVTDRGAINGNNETGSIAVNGRSISMNTTSILTSALFFEPGHNTVNSLTVSCPEDNQVLISNALTVVNKVTVSQGELNTGSGFLTLESNASGSARIGPLPSGARVSGTLNYKRYMEAEGKIYRYISSPVAGATVAGLQQFFNITGNFDGSSGNPSMYEYNEPLGGWQPFPPVGGSNLDSLKRGKGYSIYMYEGTTPITWQVLGTPHQGNIAFPLTGGTADPGDGWNLLGNPYPSPIQWAGVQGSAWPQLNGVSQTIYVRENFQGGYRWRIYRPGITSGDLGGNESILTDGVIAPGQSFWVQTAISNPSLTISENAKFANDGVFHREQEVHQGVLNITLSNGALTDQTYVMVTKEGRATFDKLEDATKRGNSFFNLSTLSSDGFSLALNNLSSDFCTEQIKVSLDNIAPGNYGLDFDGLYTFVHGAQVTLRDNFKNEELSVSDGTKYAFEVTSDPLSKGQNRFVITLKKPEIVVNKVVQVFDACEDIPTIIVTDGQSGVRYQAFYNGSPISEPSEGDVEMKLSLNATEPGEYPVTVRAGFEGCGQIDLSQNITVSIDALTNPSIQFSQGQLQVNAKDADHYTWFLNGEAIDGENSSSILPTANGEYQVMVQNGACEKLSEVFDSTLTGIILESEIRVFPNPFTNEIFIQSLNLSSPKVELLNIVGQVVAQANIDATSQRIHLQSLGDLPAGVYFLKVGDRAIRVVKE